MIDFSPAFQGQTTLAALGNGLTKDDLRSMTNELIDQTQQAIAACTDADVVFQPVDEHAHDAAAASDEHTNIAWTLAHVIVHTTAGGEESALLGAELARGVEYHGRSRYETPWETVTTIAQCRQRLEESRRIRLASLDLWPDAPHLDNTHEPFPSAGALNASGRFALGIAHEQAHTAQINDIVAQALAARK